MTASTFLNLNGYELVVSDEELYNMSMSIADANNRPSIDEASNWMRKYMGKIK